MRLVSERFRIDKGLVLMVCVFSMNEVVQHDTGIRDAQLLPVLQGEGKILGE